MSHAVIIPVYKEDQCTLDLCAKLKSLGAEHIVIVNDGCTQKSSFFNELISMGCHIVSIKKRSGKGISLRAGFEFAEKNLYNISGFITADADGQHKAEDIMRVSRALELRPDSLIIGCRDVKKSKLTLLRKIGKSFSQAYFKIITGIYCKDTLSGLRGIPATLYNALMNTDGDKFDYEMNFLTKCADLKIPFFNVNIIAMPVEKGAKASYRPVRDTYLIYRTPLRFATASIGCTAVDLALFALFNLLMFSNGLLEQFSVALATLFARIVSGSINFLINRKMIFGNNGKTGKQAMRFIILFFCIMCASSIIVTLLSFLPVPTVIVKAIVDLLLWTVNYTVQRKWVFKESKSL